MNLKAGHATFADIAVAIFLLDAFRALYRHELHFWHIFNAPELIQEHGSSFASHACGGLRVFLLVSLVQKDGLDLANP